MPAQTVFIANGQQVQSTDLNAYGEAATVLTGEAVSAIVGVADANVDDTPITVVPGGGMSVIVGGLGQRVLVQTRLADYLPAQSLAIANAASSARYDLIAFAYADVQVPTGASVAFFGSNTPEPTSYVYRGITLAVVEGTPGGSLPSAPSGLDPLAQVLVPAGATSVTAADITLLLPTISSRLVALTGGGVTGINGKNGAVGIDAGNEGIIVDNSGSDIKIDNAGVLKLNGQTGEQTIVADTGNVTITPRDGNEVGVGVSIPQQFFAVLMTFGVSPWATGRGTASAPANLVLTPGSWSVLAEFTGSNFSGGTVEMHFTTPPSNAGPTINVGAGIMSHFCFVDITVGGGQTLNPTVLVTYTNGTANQGGYCCKITAYRYA